MGNVQSLSNQMEELMVLSRLHRELKQSVIMCLTESWTNRFTPDSHVGTGLVSAHESGLKS